MLYDINEVITSVSLNVPEITINIIGEGKCYADEAIFSVFENLINNSINLGKCSKIEIVITFDDSYTEISFTDNGRGVNLEISDKIFEEGFYYGDSGHTGVGLYIIKENILRYGGDIYFDKKCKVGACFKIRLRRCL